MNLAEKELSKQNRDAWRPDWRQRLHEFLEKQGASSIGDFLARHPSIGYDRLPKLFPFPIAAVQIYLMQMAEAVQSDRVREAAMDVLVRSLNRFMPQGWGGGDDPIWELAQTFSEFGTVIAQNAPKTPDVDARVRQVFEELKSSQPQRGWLPIGPDDHLVQHAFTAGWPQGS